MTIKKIKSEYKIGGVPRVLKNSTLKIKRSLFYTTASTWYRLGLDSPINEFEPKINVTTKFLMDDKIELVDWLRIKKCEYDWICYDKEIESSFENHHHFCILKENENIIGYIKLGVGKTYIHDFDKSIHFRDKTAFICDTFMLPEYRGLNLGVYLISSASKYLQENGFTQILCHIEKWNIPSVKTFKKVGFTEQGVIRFIRIGFLKFFISNGINIFTDLEKFIWNNFPDNS